MSWFGQQAIYDRERNRAMQREIMSYNKNGFDLSIPQHCLASSYECNFKKIGRSKRQPRIVNPLRLGFQVGSPYKMHYTLPYETY
ncbi:MAG: hypothetical protein IJY57_04565, partial [Clostridia bacterium]|nr:hypothetical protein [Clostridia bacterium]